MTGAFFMSFSFCLSEPLRVRAFVFDPFDDEDEVDVDPEENTVNESLNNLDWSGNVRNRFDAIM